MNDSMTEQEFQNAMEDVLEMADLDDTDQVKVGQPAPDFIADAVIDGQFQEISLSDYDGKNVLLFFWPLDFTFVCPTEIVAFSEAVEKFAERNTVVLGVSTDSQFTHLAWQQIEKKDGGIGKINFPMIADLSHEISWKYNVLIVDQGIALRGLFLIDTEGIVRHMLVNDLPLGRSVPEALRMVDALLYFEENGEVCPANWKPGDSTIKPRLEDSKEFFAKWGK